MDAMRYFIKRFVQENRRERWLYLMEQSWDKFFDNLRQLERHLNDRCRLVEDNSVAVAQKVIDRIGIPSGVYYGDAVQNREIPLSNLDETLQSLEDGIWGCFIICRPHRTAFYLHHEGWIWICEEDITH